MVNASKEIITLWKICAIFATGEIGLLQITAIAMLLLKENPDAE